MSTENARAAITGLMTAVESYRKEADEVLLGIQNTIAYNEDPEDVNTALQEAESKYDEVIAHALMVLHLADEFLAACAVLDADGFPHQQTFTTTEAVVGNLAADLVRQQKALDRFKGVPEVIGGEIVEEETV